MQISVVVSLCLSSHIDQINFYLDNVNIPLLSTSCHCQDWSVMPPESWFQVFNIAALAGWAVLAASILLRNAHWLRALAGNLIPGGLALAYAVLIALFFASADGGFNTLADVQRLFSSPWVALAGWVHYLSFDLFVGSWIARKWEDQNVERWPLLFILPLTFLFGPAGLLTFFIMSFISSRSPLHRHSPQQESSK